MVSKLKKEGEGSWSHLTQCLGFKYSVSLLIFSLAFFLQVVLKSGEHPLTYTSSFFFLQNYAKSLGKMYVR